MRCNESHSLSHRLIESGTFTFYFCTDSSHRSGHPFQGSVSDMGALRLGAIPGALSFMHCNLQSRCCRCPGGTRGTRGTREGGHRRANSKLISDIIAWLSISTARCHLERRCRSRSSRGILDCWASLNTISEVFVVGLFSWPVASAVMGNGGR